MCNIAAFAGTKLRLQFGDFYQGGTPYFAELFFIFQNAIFHLIFVIWTKFFQVSAPLDVLFRTHSKKICILKTSKVAKKHMTSSL